jgi:hypothetical protein
MAHDLQARQPGRSLPAAVRDAAARAGRRRKPIDPLVLARARDALARLPDVLHLPVESGAPPPLDSPVVSSPRSAMTRRDRSITIARQTSSVG